MIDKSNAGEIKFRYIAKLKKDGKLNDICLEYKAKDESLYEDVKYMLHSMITISISLMLDKNVILLPSLGDYRVCMDEGYLSILAKYSQHYNSLVNELINPYVELVINKIPKK